MLKGQIFILISKMNLILISQSVAKNKVLVEVAVYDL